MTTTETKFGVWDTQFEDWDSGPYSTLEQASRNTYVPALKESDDPAKHRRSKTLVVRLWQSKGEPGDIIEA